MSEMEPGSLSDRLVSHRDDVVLPFQIEGLGIRGRVIRLGALVDQVLTRHNYPEPVSRMLGEALALTAMIGSALKFRGRFTLQTNGNGPVSMLVADYWTADEDRSFGQLRGYALMDEERLAQYLAEGRSSTPDLLGEGHLAMTIDQGADMERYQGIVALGNRGLSEAAHEYFASSEQIATRIPPRRRTAFPARRGRAWRHVLACRCDHDPAHCARRRPHRPSRCRRCKTLHR